MNKKYIEERIVYGDFLTHFISMLPFLWFDIFLVISLEITKNTYSSVVAYEFDYNTIFHTT